LGENATAPLVCAPTERIERSDPKVIFRAPKGCELLGEFVAQRFACRIVERQVQNALRLGSVLRGVQDAIDDRLRLARAGWRDQSKDFARRMDEGELVLVGRRFERSQGGAGVEV
jgi:hypothetical protein